MRAPTAFLAFLVLAASAVAADKAKPIASVNDKTIEASVVIDPALKVYPELYERLVASGKREYDKARAGAAAEFKSTSEMFSDGRKFFYKRTDRLRSAIAPYISIVRGDDTYEGGAHPNHVVDTLLWNEQTRRFMNIKPFFKEMADGGPTLRQLARLIRVALAAEKKSRDIEVGDPDTDQWLSGVKPKITDIGGIALAPSTETGKSAGLIAYFSPYAVGPYVEGEYVVFVPYKAFATALSPQGATLFGGARPEGDDKND
ncbi:MAG: DUF3298 domain-containing protein [Proteobacteria bacterium]|nr:DUF3298 domain-containing protein [Pseudomonadota bacterium]